jgi:hypothetical protein
MKKPSTQVAYFLNNWFHKFIIIGFAAPTTLLERCDDFEAGQSSQELFAAV